LEAPTSGRNPVQAVEKCGGLPEQPRRDEREKGHASERPARADRRKYCLAPSPGRNPVPRPCDEREDSGRCRRRTVSEHREREGRRPQMAASRQ